ncbi:MAG TPA: hypothetical protein DEO50_10995, partial [Erysipelotrichaceae bacterium]|nr:hypothetical protein [Erysipelotrichaceae bacterium]
GTFAWEGRKLTSFDKTGLAVSYTYNENGIRTSKTVNTGNDVTTNYRLSGDRVTFEQTGSDTIYYVYDTQGQLISMILNNVEYAYLRNAQNDIVGLINSAGVQVVSYTYSTWGEVLSITGTLASTVGQQNPYRYRGYRYDSETGLYYLQSRYYNPQWGRFMNADGDLNLSLGLQGTNIFEYCINNPINKVDELGNKPGDLFKTKDDAAYDFGMYYNAESIVRNKEYGSTIYIVRKIKIRFTSSRLLVEIQKFYSYTKAKIGTSDSVTPPIKQNMVATVHTHAAYIPKLGNGNNVFSGCDKFWADFFGITSYLVNPKGELKKYGDGNNGIEPILRDLPVDSRYYRRR